MTPDELRALADALEPMARAPRFEDFDVPAFCAWLRAQAEAQPVAWMYEHDGCVDPPVFTVNRWTKCEEPWNESPLFLHPAPAAPQAEPKPTPASGDDLSVYKEMADSYRNDAEPTGAPYGIIDPDYGRVYTIARKLAWEEGYAIGLHGSFTRDLDLIAVPWTDTACEPEHLIRRIVDATGLKLRDGVAVKPHGRRAWTLKFPTFGDPRFVDLSVMPRIGGSDAE